MSLAVLHSRMQGRERPPAGWPPATAWTPRAHPCPGAGLITAVPATGTGVYEAVRLGQDRPATRTVLRHLGARSGAPVRCLASLLLRSPGAAPESVGAAAGLSLAGLACPAVGGAFASRLA